MDLLENESLSEEAEHDPTLEWIGCPKCGLPINITIPVKDFGYELLAYVYDMLAQADVEDAREAIGVILLWLGSEITDAKRRNPHFWPLISTRERAEEANRHRAQTETPRAGRGQLGGHRL